MTSHLPSLTDWQTNLLGSDEAGAYLMKQMASARSEAQAMAIFKSFMQESFSCLDKTVQGMGGDANLSMRKDLSSCINVLKNDCAARKDSFSMTPDDNVMAKKLRPADFMAVYEKSPPLAENDWVTFQMLGDFSRVHEKASAMLSSYFQRLAHVEKAACPGQCREERVQAGKLVELQRTLAKNPVIEDVGACMEACRTLSEDYVPAHGAVGVMRIVHSLINQAFDVHEKDVAAGRKDAAYPNPFGLRLTAEIRAEDRSTMECLRDFFQPVRLSMERRNRMKMAIVRSPEVLEGICAVLAALHDMDAGHKGTLVLDCERVSARIAEISARGERFAALAREDAEVADVRMVRLDASLSNRVDGMLKPELPKDRLGKNIRYSRQRR